MCTIINLQAVKEAKEKRDQGLPTIPSTMEHELATNPFLRVEEPSIMVSLFSECD
jgi:hydroxyacylglutathione hydrolase